MAIVELLSRNAKSPNLHDALGANNVLPSEGGKPNLFDPLGVNHQVSLPQITALDYFSLSRPGPNWKWHIFTRINRVRSIPGLCPRHFVL
jgi:hypothetical protein